MLKNWKKNGKNYQKYAKIRDVKILQDVSFNQEDIQYPIFKPRGGSLALKAKRNLNDKKFQNS